MKIKIQSITDNAAIVAGVIINANILTLIATITWPAISNILDLDYPGYFSVQALCLCALSIVFAPLSPKVVDRMWERFFYSISILSYITILWVFGLL